MAGSARVGVCDVSFISAGHQGQSVPGLRDKDFTTQGRHAEIVAECDRYVIL
jgi:hypothetical protein